MCFSSHYSVQETGEDEEEEWKSSFDLIEGKGKKKKETRWREWRGGRWWEQYALFILILILLLVLSVNSTRISRRRERISIPTTPSTGILLITLFFFFFRIPWNIFSAATIILAGTRVAAIIGTIMAGRGMSGAIITAIME